MIVAWVAAALAATECGALDTPPESFQVAWVSRLGKSVSAISGIQVVRVTELRKLVDSKQRDATAILRALGLLGARGTATDAYKVTIFDVKRDWLCRPVDADAGTTLGGVAVCPGNWQGPEPGTRGRSYGGCGYLEDTATGARTLDVYRLSWENAVTWGFCVLPISRFLGGA